MASDRTLIRLMRIRDELRKKKMEIQNEWDMRDLLDDINAIHRTASMILSQDDYETYQEMTYQQMVAPTDENTKEPPLARTITLPIVGVSPDQHHGPTT